MAVQGDLQTMSIADILQWLSLAKKTGILVLQKRDRLKELVFNEGEFIWVTTNDPREQLGQLALQKNLLGESQLREALEVNKKMQLPLGQVLLEMNVLDKPKLKEMLTESFVNIVHDIFVWESGQFLFREEGVKRFVTEFAIQLGVDHLILEGARRFDEWQKLKKSFPTYEMIISTTAAMPSDFENAFENRLLEQARQQRSLGEIILDLRVHDYHVLRIFKDWLRKGWLTTTQDEAVRLEELPLPREDDRQLSYAEDQKTIAQVGAAIDKQDYEAALNLLDRIENPALARQISELHRRIEEPYCAEFYRLFGRESIPRVALSIAELVSRDDIDSKSAFVLSRIDGKTNTATLAMASPTGELGTLKILKFLHQEKIIHFSP